MKFAKRVLMVAGSVALACALAAMIAPRAAHAVAALLVQVTNTPANPVVTTTQTHVGVKATQIVTLVCSPTFIHCRAGDWKQVPANGDDTTSFAIPSGQALVITDFEWRAGASGIAGFNAFSGDLLFGNNVFVTVMSAPATLNPDGTASGAEHLTAGVVVESLPDAFVNFTSGITGSASASFWIHGYLVPVN